MRAFSKRTFLTVSIFITLIGLILINFDVIAQEGTKQLMPNNNITERLWLEFELNNQTNGTEGCPENERINIYLKAGEKIRIGMKMADFAEGAYYGGAYTYYIDDFSFRLRKPDNTAAITRTQIPGPGENGFISTYSQAVNGPNGAILNGQTISGGYTPITYTATVTGNHFIEFESWDNFIGGTRNTNWRFALEHFDVTVTDAADNIITNPGDPNRSAGRLWSKNWAFTTASFTQYPINANFYVVTSDEFINKVNFKQYPYSFTFVANKYGIKTEAQDAHYVRRTQSQVGNQISGSIGEYPVFLNDPDRSVWPNTMLPPPTVKVWAENEKFFDYKYNRNPMYVETNYGNVVLEKNFPTCLKQDITFFKIDANIDGFTAILIDANNDGTFTPDGSDRVIYKELRKGLNYILWDFKRDNGADVPNGTYSASATLYGRGPSHFPMHDVEQLDGIVTSAIRPFNKLTNTIYWDDRNIQNPTGTPSSTWGDLTGKNLMNDTEINQLKVGEHLPRKWSWSTQENTYNNGNRNTMNTWFNAIDLGYSDITLVVSESTDPNRCFDGDISWVGDLWMEGPKNTDITFTLEDFNFKYFHPLSIPLGSIEVQSLPSNGTLKYNGSAILTGQLPLEIAAADISNLTFTPTTGWFGQTNFLWRAKDSNSNWSNNQEHVYLVINTPPTITPIGDQTICANSSTGPINFTIGDGVGETPLNDLVVTGFSAYPEVVPHENVVIGGTGANRTVTVTPKENQGGMAIVYIMVDDGFTQTLEEFAVTIMPSLEFTGDTAICYGNGLSLRAVEYGADSYSWKFEGSEKSNTSSLTQVAASVDLGLWSLTIQQTKGTKTCTSTRDFTVKRTPDVSFTGDKLVCIGEEISLAANEPNASYQWKRSDNPTPVSTQQTWIKNAALTDSRSDYTLTVTKNTCTHTSDPFAINVKPQPNTGLTVTGSTVDPGQGGTITIQNSETGFDYLVYKGATYVTTVAGGDAALIIPISTSSLVIGNNEFRIVANNTNCEYELLNKGIITVNTPGVTVTPTTLSTSENGVARTFTVKLNTQPANDVSIAITSGNTDEGTVSPASLTFTDANWNTTQTVTVTPVRDWEVDGTKIYTIDLAPTASADSYYNGVVDPDNITVTNTDVDAAGVTVSKTALTTTEVGGSDSFTLALTSKPSADVTITFSGVVTTEGDITIPVSETVTFNSSNWDSPQIVTITGINDLIDDDDYTYSINISSTSGDTDYSGISISSVSVTNLDDDTAGITVSPTSITTYEAGGYTEFNVRLNTEPSIPVTMSVVSSNSLEGTVSPSTLTFSSADWNTEKPVRVYGANDFVVDGNQNYQVDLTVTVGGTKYLGKTAIVSAVNTDDDVAGIISSVLSVTTAEPNVSTTFQVKLKSQPTAPVKVGITSSNVAEGAVSPAELTFNTLEWDTYKDVTVTGVDDYLIDGNIAYTVTLDVTQGDAVYNAVSDVVINTVNNDNDVAGIDLSKTTVTTNESGTTDQFNVRLTAKPNTNVTLSISGLDATEGSLSVSTITFTTDNWNSYQSVTVTGVDDAIADGNQTYTLTVAYSSGDANFSSVSRTVSDTNIDNDAAGITVSPTTLSTTEGLTNTFSISLSSQPTANVTINLTSGNLAEGTVSPAAVLFTNSDWSAKTVTVTGVTDDIDDNNQTYTITTSNSVSTDGNYSNKPVADVTVTNVDINTAGVSVNPTSGLTTTEVGGTANYSVRLNSKPTNQVTITSVSGTATEGLVTTNSTLSFSTADWNTWKQVTVAGVDDNKDDNDQPYTVTLSASSSDTKYAGISISSVSLTNTDDDIAEVLLSQTSGLVTTEAGGTATFTVRLKTEPLETVTIVLSSSNTAEGTVSPTPISFNAGNYNTPRTITLSGVNDLIDDGNQPYTITLTATSVDTKYNNISIPTVSATNTDDDTAGVTVSTISGNTTEALGTATYTVKLNSEPTSVVTIASASNNSAEGTVISGNNLSFNSSNWNTNQTVTVRGVDDLVDDGNQTYAINLAATSGDGNYQGITISPVSVINVDNDDVGLVISKASISTTEPNGTDNFTVKLNTQPTGTVTVAVTSSDLTEGTVSPATLTFTTVNWNTTQPVTVTSQDDPDVDGNVNYNINLKASSTIDTKYNNLVNVAVPATNSDNDVAGITVDPYAGLSTTEAGGTTTFTVVLTSRPTNNVSIRLTSSNSTEGYVSAVTRGTVNVAGNEATISFTPAQWNSPVTVTITGVDDDVDDDNIAYYIVTEVAVSSDANYNVLNPRDVSVTNNDNDTYGTTVTPTTLSFVEGGAAKTSTIVLRSRPTSTVRFNTASSNTSRANVSPAYVEFLSTGDSWKTAQTVTVTPINNSIADGPADLNIVFAPVVSTDNNYKDYIPGAINVTIDDDDVADITVSNISGFTTELGGTATFSVVLTSQPTNVVTITMYSGNTAEGIITNVTPGRGVVGPGNTAYITFNSTNWNQPVTITVQGVDDLAFDGSQTYQIEFLPTESDDLNYDEINLDPVEIINQDNDAAGYTVYPVSGLTTNESGTTAQFNVFLNSQPTGNVVVNLTSSNIAEGVITSVTRGTCNTASNTATITFDATHWNVDEEVTVTVTGIDDLIADGDISYTINLSADVVLTVDSDYEIPIPSVTLTNLDDFTPRPVIDNETTDQENSIVINVLDNDLGLDYGATVSVVSQPEYGTAIANADNTITYTPNRNYHGNYSFTYSVCNSLTNCANSTVNITVTWVDVTPIANDDSRGTSINTPVVVDVLFNDGNLFDIPIAVSTVGSPNPGGTLSVSNNTVIFTPSADYIGMATFTYRLTDNDGDTDDGTVTINVRVINHTPIANNDVASILKNTPSNINVLANDSGLEDGWGDLIIHQQPTNGTVLINPDRTIKYTPNIDYIGGDNFIYLLRDIDGDYDLATVTLTITEVPNHIPVAYNVSRATEMNIPVDIDVLFNDTGLEDGVAGINLSPAPANGTATVEYDAGNNYYFVNYIPDTDWIGTEVFGYQVCDIDGDCSGIATITVIVKETGTNHNPVANDDEVDTYINNPITIAVLNNDNGLEDGIGEIVIHSNPSAGTATVNAENTITYTPSYMYVGTVTFEYRVADIDGDWDKATVTVNITEIPNFVPIANNDSCATSFNQSVTIDVLFNDENKNDEPLTINITEVSANGNAIVNANNSVTFTPTTDYVGITTFKYTITDKDGDTSNEATVSVNVKSGTNYVPVANNDNATTFINTYVDIDVLSNDSGLEDGFGALTIHVHPLFGTVTVNANRTIRFTPGNFFIGEETFTYILTDSDGDFSAATVTITVTEKPDYLPVANDDRRATEFITAVTVDVLTNDTGLEDGGIAVSITTAPDLSKGVALANGDNTVTFTPAPGFSGAATFAYTVVDKDGDSDDATVTITVLPDGITNHVPVAVNDNATTIVNTPVEVSVLANDTGLEDGFGLLRIHAAPGHGTTTINANRTITYTPSNLFIGSDSFQYWLEDAHGDYDIATVSITVNDKPNYTPVANNDRRGTEYQTAVSVDVLVNDTGLEDGGIVVTITTSPNVAVGSAIVNGDNTLTFTPAAGFSGIAVFGYTVRDKDGDSGTATVTITVLPDGVTNHTPVAADDAAATIVNKAVDINVLANDSGLEDGFGDLIIHTSPLHGTVAVNANRTITYTPSNLFIGSDSFQYWLEDVHGDYDIATVSLTVNDKPNYIPVANDDNRGASFNTPVIVNVLINDTGLDDGGIKVTISEIPDPLKGTAIANADNTVTFTPTTGYIGIATFQYKVEDKDGDSDIATVTINVKSGINLVPVAVDDAAITTENKPVSINVLSNDSNLEDGIKEVIIYRLPKYGTVVVNANLTVTYTPSPWVVGLDNFDYMVSDLDGDYDIGNVSITVNPIANSLPVANDDSRGATKNTAVIVDVLVNDKGLDDGGIKVTISSSPDPLKGTAIANPDNTVTFTPATNYIGLAAFLYKVEDKDGDWDEASVAINVKEYNYVPLAKDDVFYAKINTTSVFNVLDNDTGLDDGGLKVELLNQVMAGQAVVNADNTISYIPLTGFIGTDNFTYTITDIDGDYDIAQVTVIVTSGAVPGFIITPVSMTTSEDGTNTAISVSLSVVPTSDVTISFTSNDLTEGTLSPATLTFTLANWNTAQIVTITGVNDFIIDGSVVYTITASVVDALSDDNFDPLFDQTVTVTNTDNDLAGFILSKTTATTSEALTSDNFTVVLNAQPNSDVVISATSGDITEGAVSPETLTFTTANWNIPQQVTVTGVKDLLTDGNVSYNVTMSIMDVSTDDNFDVLADQIVVVANIDNNSPVAVNDENSINERETDVMGNILDNDTDVDGDALAVSQINGSSTITSISGSFGSIACDALGNYTYTIDNSNDDVKNLNNNKTLTDTITYEITDGNGGFSNAKLIVTINGYTNLDDVIVPQGFSPDGNGISDKFVIGGIENYPDNELIVYNRWGTEVYRKKHYNNEWDGSSSNNKGKLPVATYFYVLTVKGKNSPFRGYVYIKY